MAMFAFVLGDVAHEVIGHGIGLLISLRDGSRINDPILIRNPTRGVYQRASTQTTNAVRVDWLVSYHPIPGTCCTWATATA